MRGLIFISCLLSFFTTQAQPRWSYDTLSTDGRFHTVAVVDSNIYLFYGRQTRGTFADIPLKQMEIINTYTGKHTVLAVHDSILNRRPSTSSQFSSEYKVLKVNKDLLFMGNSDNNKIDIFHTADNTWGTPIKLPRSRVAMGIAQNDSLLIFAGGSGENGHDRRMDFYNLKDSSWTTKELTYRPVTTSSGIETGTYGYTHSAAAFISSNKIFMIGGVGLGTPAYIYDHFRSYDLNTEIWNLNQGNNLRPNPFPYQAEPRYNSLVNKYKDKVFVSGGHTFTEEEEEFAAATTIEVYNTSTDSWSHLDIPRIFKNSNNHSVSYKQTAVAGSKLFLVAQRADNATADSVAIYDLERHSWEFIGLPHSGAVTSVAAVDNKVYFMGGQVPDWNTTLKHIDIYHLYPKLEVLTMTGDTLQSINEVFALSEDSEETISLRLHNTGDYKAFFAQNEVQLTVNNKVTLTPITLPDSLNPAEEVILTFNIDISEEAVIKDTIIVNTNITGLEELKIPLEFTIEEKDPNAIPDITALEKQFTLYPNPASNQVQVKIPQKTTTGSQIRLLNISGTILTEKTVQNNVETLSLSTIAPGLYFVQLEIEGYLMTRKLVVE